MNENQLLCDVANRFNTSITDLFTTFYGVKEGLEAKVDFALGEHLEMDFAFWLLEQVQSDTHESVRGDCALTMEKWGG